MMNRDWIERSPTWEGPKDAPGMALRSGIPRPGGIGSLLTYIANKIVNDDDIHEIIHINLTIKSEDNNFTI